MPVPEPVSHPCPVCQKAVNGRARHCPRCGRILDRARIFLPVAMIIAALIEACDSAAGAFRCHYSGARLDTDRPRHPFYLVFIS